MFLKQMEIVVDEDKIRVDIQKVCMERKTIKKWAYILHDKDDTRNHYHIYLNFGNSSINTVDVDEIYVYDSVDKDGRPKGLGAVYKNELVQLKKEKAKRTDFKALFGAICEVSETNVYFIYVLFNFR